MRGKNETAVAILLLVKEKNLCNQKEKQLKTRFNTGI